MCLEDVNVPISSNKESFESECSELIIKIHKISALDRYSILLIKKFVKRKELDDSVQSIF